MSDQGQKIVTKIEANPLLTQNKPSDGLLRVAAYCRVSTDDEDQLNSYEAQVSYYKKYISQNPQWRFVDIYADKGITGTAVDKRENFIRMIKDCEKGKIDLILTKSVSRFARNTVDALQYVRKLKAKNIGVFFEEQNCNTLNEDSEMFIGIYSVIAQTESENISANVKWGIQKRMRNGTYACQFKILGYEKNNGEVVIIPEEAEIVKTIFSKYLDGYSIDQLKEYLETTGMKTKQGKSEWSKATIKSMLTNEKYTGDVLFQKTFRVDCISKKTVINRGEKTRYLVSNHHPAIIDRDTFRLVQAEIARRSNKSKKSDKAITKQGKYSGKYVLSELLVCGECGSPYRRRIKSDGNEKVVYWRCLNRIEHGKEACPHSKGIREDELQAAICRALANAINNEEVCSLINSNLKYALSNDDNSLDIFTLETNIHRLQEEADEIMKLWTSSGSNGEKYEAEIEKLYEQIKALREQLELSKSKAEANDSIAEASRLTELFASKANMFDEFDDIIVHNMVERIVVCENKDIEIALKCGFKIEEYIL